MDELENDGLSMGDDDLEAERLRKAAAAGDDLSDLDDPDVLPLADLEEEEDKDEDEEEDEM